MARTAVIHSTGSDFPRPIVRTTAGDVRGRIEDGVNIFKGIPYGASTAHENRFLPPRKPLPWTGIREATTLGPQSPQDSLVAAIAKAPASEREGMQNFMKMFAGVWQVDPVCAEDCLVLNVWTKSFSMSKRPVMVWLHGGGFTGGSGGAPWYDGSHLARNEDVVVVTLNHRLNLLGYLYLGELSPDEYADSGNAGMLDIVSALHWVRDNIAAFGGDEGNVTLFGQSGGAWKINTLMAMPASRGLFHRAVLQSGPGLQLASRSQAAELARSVLQSLGLKPAQVGELKTISAQTLLAAVPRDLLSKLGPVIDERTLSTQPLHPAALELSSGIPVLIGSVQDDAQQLSLASLSIDEAGLEAKVRLTIGGDEHQSKQLIASYRQRHDQASPADLLTMIVTDYSVRVSAITEAERRAARGKAPVYMYLFAWRSRFMEGRFKTPHNTELSFVFDNLAKAPALVGTHPDAQTVGLARAMGSAWAAFARTGSPACAALPDWQPYRTTGRATMILDRTSELVGDPRAEDRIAIEPLLRSS